MNLNTVKFKYHIYILQPTSGFEDFIVPDLENIKNKFINLLTIFSEN